MILIRKVKDPHGCYGNMAPYPVTFQEREYRTTEALFQTMRFTAETIREAIRAERSPMAAKFVSKRHRVEMTVVPMSTPDLDNMRVCLRLKMDQHPGLAQRLIATGNERTIEDCTKRPNQSGLFRGAKNDDGQWIGENWLGRLLMELREELINKRKQI